MGEIWIREAEDLKPSGLYGSMDGGKPKATWHVTVSPSGNTMFGAMDLVLRNNKSEPHILYDPATDRMGQYFPLNRSARALANDGPRRTNGAGIVNIQIEVVANTSPVFTSYWKPGPNFRALMRAIRSWDIPDAWPAGALATSYASRTDRSWASYNKAGHFGHCNVPGNDHWDPGPIDKGAIFRAAAKPAPQEEDVTPADIKAIAKATADLMSTPEYISKILDLDVADYAWGDGKTSDGRPNPKWRLGYLLSEGAGHAYKANVAATGAQKLAAKAAALGRPLTNEETKDAVAEAITEIAADGFDVDVNLTPKGN